eukprot:jgi/Tetstr1/446610/TSEL_034134.t1
MLRAVRLRTIVIYLTASEFDLSELHVHPFSKTGHETPHHHSSLVIGGTRAMDTTEQWCKTILAASEKIKATTPVTAPVEKLAADASSTPSHSHSPTRNQPKHRPPQGAMDPKRDFRLPGAAALASEAKQFGISVATLKNIGSEWEYEGSDEEYDLELSPTTGRVLVAPERRVKHGTVECGAAYCLPCLAEAEAFIITDVDGGQPTDLLYKIPAGTLCRPCKQNVGNHPRSSTPRQPDGRKPWRADGTAVFETVTLSK